MKICEHWFKFSKRNSEIWRGTHVWSKFDPSSPRGQIFFPKQTRFQKVVPGREPHQPRGRGGHRGGSGGSEGWTQAERVTDSVSNIYFHFWREREVHVTLALPEHSFLAYVFSYSSTINETLQSCRIFKFPQRIEKAHTLIVVSAARLKHNW